MRLLLPLHVLWYTQIPRQTSRSGLICWPASLGMPFPPGQLRGWPFPHPLSPRTRDRHGGPSSLPHEAVSSFRCWASGLLAKSNSSDACSERSKVTHLTLQISPQGRPQCAVPTHKRRNSRHRTVKEVLLGHTASERQSPESNPGCLPLDVLHPDSGPVSSPLCGPPARAPAWGGRPSHSSIPAPRMGSLPRPGPPLSPWPREQFALYPAGLVLALALCPVLLCEMDGVSPTPSPPQPGHHVPGNQPPLPSAFDPEPSILCPLPSCDVVLASSTGLKPDFPCSSLPGKWLCAHLPRSFLATLADTGPFCSRQQNVVFRNGQPFHPVRTPSFRGSCECEGLLAALCGRFCGHPRWTQEAPKRVVMGLRPQSQDVAGTGPRPGGTLLACLAPVTAAPFNKAFSTPLPQVLLGRLYTVQLQGGTIPVAALRPF